MKNDITQAEMEVLKALWKTGTGSVREIADHLPKKNQRAYTTLQTLLKRLEDKGVVTRSKDKQPHVYAAKVSRQGLMKARLAAIAEEFCDGAAGPMLMALVERNKFSQKELESFQDLVEKLDREED